MTSDGVDPEVDEAASGRGHRQAPSVREPVDPDWYRARYPDVSAVGADPAAHYAAHGRAEGRHPTASAELAALGETLDAAWYRARYPDVAAAGTDPARHFLLYGRAEGRHPSADREPPHVWDSRFDAVWYRARNADLGRHEHDPLEHFRRVGLLEGRAANAAEEDRAGWRGILDAEWYLARNPDVARRGLDPLEHFITEGLVQRRRPNADVVLPSEPVTEARIDRLRGGTFGAEVTPEVALFVTHAPDGVIKPHVAHHVACLKRCGITCALIVASDSPEAAVAGEAADIADHLFRRANAGFDFAAWAHVLRLHPEILDARILYLVNDSVFGPTSQAALGRVVERVRASAADLVGLTDNAERGWHVQSYFLALKRRFHASDAGRAFFEGVVAYGRKDDVVNEYETQAARRALEAGFRVEVMFPTPDWLDATLHNWRRLLRAGFPYLKIGTARGLVAGVETADWRAEMAARGYETGPADRTLARMARGAGGASRADEDPDEGACLAEMHAFLADGDTIMFPAAERPAVSFVAVVGDHPERLLRLLRAIAKGGEARAPAQREFIVVDNASTDDTHHVLGRLAGATVVTNVAPLLPSRAARRALARARAEAVVLLVPCAPTPELQTTDAPSTASEPGRTYRDILEGLAPAGTGPVYAPRAAPRDASWSTFDIADRGRRLGTAHAFLRRHASDVLTGLFGDPDQSGADTTSPPGVL